MHDHPATVVLLALGHVVRDVVEHVEAGVGSQLAPPGAADPDGDGTLNGIDVVAGRNAFTSPPYVSLDMRFAKRFNIGERASRVPVL